MLFEGHSQNTNPKWSADIYSLHRNESDSYALRIWHQNYNGIWATRNNDARFHHHKHRSLDNNNKTNITHSLFLYFYFVHLRTFLGILSLFFSRFVCSREYFWRFHDLFCFGYSLGASDMRPIDRQPTEPVLDDVCFLEMFRKWSQRNRR